MSSNGDFPIVGIVRSIDPAFVHPMPNQPRTEFDEGELEELADSIRVAGQEQLGKVKEAGKRAGKMHYQLISGERRWRACKMIGRHFEAVVVPEADSATEFLHAMVANKHGVDLSPIDMAAGLARMKLEKGLTDVQLGEYFGSKSPAWATQYLSLLRLDLKVRRLMALKVPEEKRIKFWIGVRLVPFPPHKQVELAERISRRELSMKEALALIRKEMQRIEEKSGKRLTLRSPNRDFSVVVNFITNMKSEAAAVLSFSNLRFREMFARRLPAEKKQLLKEIRQCINNLHELEEAIEGTDTMLSRRKLQLKDARFGT